MKAADVAEMSNISVNVTMNSPMGVPFPSRIALTLAYTVAFLVAIVGNALIIHVVRRHRNMRTAFNYLIVNMAVADILNTMVAMPAMVLFLFVLSRWLPGVIGTITCKLVNFAVNLSITTSVLTLAVIAVDRYLAIVHVMKRPLSLKAVKGAISAVWIVSGILFTGELYKFRVIQSGEDSHCIPAWSEDESKKILFTRYEMIVKLVVTYAIPMGLMVVLYTLMVWCLWHRRAPGEFSDENQRRIKKQMKKVITMLITIVLIFNICWIPVHANHFLIAFNFDAYSQLPPVVRFGFYWLAHANSAINPCLYFIFNESFREGLKKVLRRLYQGGNTRVRYRSSTLRSTISPTTPTTAFSLSPLRQSIRKNTDDNSSEKLIPPNLKQIKESESVAMRKIHSSNRKASLDEKQSSSYFKLSPPKKRRYSCYTEALINDTHM